MAETIVTQLKALLLDELVADWENVEPSIQAALCQVADPRQVRAVVFPRTVAELAEVVAWAARDRHHILPLGSGSKLGWGGLLSGIHTSQELEQSRTDTLDSRPLVAVSLARLNRLVEHAVGDLTLTAEAGMSLQALQKILSPVQQQLGVDPAFPHRATLGGIVATADTGSLRQGYGSIRDRVLGITLVRSDGQVVNAGGRVVKNVAGYDLMKLMTGSYGTLGILAQMTVRLYPLPESSTTIAVTGHSDSLATIARRIRSSSLSPTRFDWISPACANAILETSGQQSAIILQFQSIPASVEQQGRQIAVLAEEAGLEAIGVEDEHAIWQQLQSVMGHQQVPKIADTVGCKFGLLPANVANFLEVLGPSVCAQVHVGSGIGWVNFLEVPSIETLLQLRTVCQENSGYFTVLQAPKELKHRLDIWGYAEGSLGLMRAIAHKFDPDSLFNPERLLPSR